MEGQNKPLANLIKIVVLAIVVGIVIARVLNNKIENDVEKHEAVQQTAEAKEKFAADDAKLSECFQWEAQKGHFSYYSYNDFGDSARTLLLKCSHEVLSWCSTVDCKFDQKGGLSDMLFPDEDGMLTTRAITLANDAIKHSVPATVHNLIEDQFRDCVMRVISKSHFVSETTYQFSNEVEYQDVLMAHCSNEIQNENEQCVKEQLQKGNDATSANSLCGQTTGFIAVTMLRTIMRRATEYP